MKTPMGGDVHGMMMRMGSMETANKLLIREKMALHASLEKLEVEAGRIQLLLMAILTKGGGTLKLTTEDLGAVENGTRIRAHNLEDGAAVLEIVRVGPDGRELGAEETTSPGDAPGSQPENAA